METENNNNEEVKEFGQTIYVEPTKDDELVENEEESETLSSSSDEEKDLEPTENEEEETPPVVEEEQEAETPKVEPKPVEGETPRERALRLEMARVKALLRQERQDELFVKKPINNTPQEDLSEYDPEELKRFETLAIKMGFAKKDEILQQTTQEKNNLEFEAFMEAHPEYSPENDKDGTLWNQFKAEFALYNPPQDPKSLKKILNKVHNEIYGVKPATNLNKINASREKINVASHTGASASKVTKTQPQKNSGLRVDAFKGFSEEEIKELLS